MESGQERPMSRRNPLSAGGAFPADTHPVHRRKRHLRRRARHPADSVSTRDRILEAAYRTLVELGYTQVSMRRIAEEAGVNQSLLHYYYGSKENLMLEVLQYVNDQLIARQRKMYAEAGSFEAIWDRALEYFKEDVRSGFVRALWELWAQGLSNPRIKRRWVEIAGQWHDLVVGLARQALEERGISGEYDPEVIASVIADVYYGAEVNILAFGDTTVGLGNTDVHFEAVRLIGTMFRRLVLDAERKRLGETAAADS